MKSKTSEKTIPGIASFRTPTKLEYMIDTAVRDFTKIMPLSKSEVRRRIMEIIEESNREEKKYVENNVRGAIHKLD